ncbi:hypothetical protein JJB09_15530 [Rhizobium sp. KVB221]|uniref:MFS transporter n=1 Tax=Rhizobium setariae TaxID=2801340 RepID=A0A937CLQ9_9HYPH|nr:hypothetical protein [Rhizobium setariae]MBL0373445.1 hypothetical protein [Rhizobium setariae]
MQTDSMDRQVNISVGVTGLVFAIGILGACSFMLAPFYVAGLVVIEPWTASSAGFSVAIELWGAALGSLAMARARPAALTGLGLLMLSIANALAGFFLIDHGASVPLIYALRFVAGLGGGACLAAAYVALGSTRDPDRYFGLLLAVALAVSGVAYFTLPWLLERIGIAGIFFGLAAIAVLLMAAYWRVADSIHFARSSSGAGNLAASSEILIAIVLLYTAQGAVWTFVERIAVVSGIDPSVFGLSLAASSATGFLGGLVNAIQGKRGGRRIPVAIALIATVALLYMMILPVNALYFAIAVCGLQFAWCYVTPFLMGGLAETLDDMRSLSVGVFTQLAGLGLGPFVAATLLETGSDISMVPWVAMAATLLAVLAAVRAMKHR